MAGLPVSELAKLQRAFAAAIRDPQAAPVPQGLDKKRMGIYQDLFYNNIEGFLAGCYPVLKEISQNTQMWEKLVRGFVAGHACQTPYFLKICEEFLDYLQSDNVPVALPDYALHLAHWEWMELYADTHEADVSDGPWAADLLNAIPVISPLAWLCHYPCAVHEISARHIPSEHSQTFLLIYRHAEAVGFSQLNALSALLFERLQNNAAAQSAAGVLAEIAADSGLDRCIVLQGGAEILKQWQLCGVICKTLPTQ